MTGNSSPAETYTTSIRAHHICRLATAVVRITWARAVASAEDLANSAWERGDDFLCAVDSDGLACTDARNLRLGVSTKACCSRRAALEGARTRALVGLRGARAVAGPAAVTSTAVAAGSLGAAFNASGIFRTSATNGDAAIVLAFAGAEANAWVSVVR